jgi:hypothetical protein
MSFSYVKYILLFLILSSILVFSCSNSESAPIVTASLEAIQVPVAIITPTALSRVEQSETVEILPKEHIDQLGLYPFLISPDGKKIALDIPFFHINEQASLLIHLYPLISNESVNIIEVQLDRASTYYYVDSWSPDSTAFAGGFYDASLYSGGEWCCGEGIAITDVTNGKAQTSIYSWNWNYANRISWSDDSSMLSIDFYTDKYDTVIVDRQGALVKTLNKGEKTAFWLGNILYFTAKKDDKIELRSWDFDTQESNLISDDFGYKSFIAKHKETNEVLLKDDHANPKFYILDLNKKSSSKIASPNPEITWAYPTMSSPSEEYVALRVTMEWEENSLWIYDWTMHEFEEYGRINDLFGWYENIDGFLVTSLEGNQKIIRP